MKKLFTLFFSLGVMMTFAQKKDSLSHKEDDGLKIASLPYYNFGKGVGMTSPDSLFQLNIRFRMQNRLEVLNDDDKTYYDAAVRRLRLRFDGYVGNPKLQYAIQLSFAPRDVGAIESGSNLNVIRDAMIFYNHNKYWRFGFGQTKLPGNRQRVNSSGALQLSDRSINNSNFNIDRDFGFQAYYINNHSSDKFGFSVKTAISTGEGRNWTKTKDDGLAYTGRLELYPLGKFKKGGEFFEGDLARETSPKIYLGATYHYNQRAMRTNGQQGDLLYDARDISAVLADAMLKYNGWAFMASYLNRKTPNASAITTKTDASGAISREYVFTGSGYDLQASYLFPKNWELIGRVSDMKPHSEIFQFTPKQQQFSLGLTKYIWEHAFKAQMEVSKNYFQYFDGSKKDNWYLRFQVEIGI